MIVWRARAESEEDEGDNTMYHERQTQTQSRRGCGRETRFSSAGARRGMGERMQI